MKIVAITKSAARRGLVKAAIEFSKWSRNRKADRIESLIASTGARSALLVGTNPTKNLEFANIVEGRIADSISFFVPTGLLEDDATGRLDYETTWDRYVNADGLNLPFRDNAFDLVVSNAVIEHVGQEGQQRRFVEEHLRVGRHVVITTPNRWFPIESHHRVVFLHWRKSWWLGQEMFTRLLSRKEFADLLPADAEITGSSVAPTFWAEWKS